jgi:sulfite dehydrogenase (quinone) subunit SoeC
LKPALSLVFFTVLSGAGLGTLAVLALAYGGGAPRGPIVAGIVLVTLGLLSSVLHLASPRNAWRSFMRFRTSWLSREAVFAILLYPAVLAWWLGLAGAAYVVLVLAWLILVCTAMIYASLKPIREWRSPLVPLNFFLLGHYSGALVALALTGDARLVVPALVLLLAAGAAKVAYYRTMDDAYRPTVQAALGMPSAARVKLLDAGHSHGTYLTEEFAFRLARGRAEQLRLAVAAGGFLLPLVLVLFLEDAFPLAALLCLAGLLAERWLFFAEARHTVNLYQKRRP